MNYPPNKNAENGKVLVNSAINHLAELAKQHQFKYQECKPEHYSITSVFNEAKAGKNDGIRPQSLWRMFEKLYIKINYEVLGRNFHRKSKRHLQPVTYSFIDVEGSRYKGLASSDISNAVIPHLHSVMQIHPVMTVKYHELFFNSIELEKMLQTDKRLNIKSLHIQKINNRDIEHTMDYSAKLLLKVPPDTDIRQLWNIHPKSVIE